MYLGIGAATLGAMGLGYILFSKRNKVDSWANHVVSQCEIKQLAPDLMVVKAPGRPDRNMVAFVMKNGAQWLHSVIALPDDSQKKVEAMGNPQVMVVPNGMHRMDCAVYKQRYPSLQVHCPAVAQAQVERVVKVDETYSQTTDAETKEMLAANGVKFHCVPGVKTECVYELALQDGTSALVFCDFLFNLPPESGFIPWLLGSTTDGKTPKVTPLFKMASISDRQSVKGWLIEQSQRTDVTVLTMSHGNPVVGMKQVQEALAAAAAGL